MLTNLGAGTANTNPPSTVSMTTLAALAVGESALIEVVIPNDGPTAVVVTVAGVAASVVVTSSRPSAVTTVLAGYKNTTGAPIASGATIQASWTNGGTQNGGGAGISAIKTDKNIDPTTADTTGTGASFGTTASATSGAPSSATADYVAVSSEGHTNGGSSSTPAAPTGWTGSTLAWNSTRTMGGRVAAIELTAPGTAQTATWGAYPANTRWAATVAMFKVVAAGGTLVEGSASLVLTLGVTSAGHRTARASATLALNLARTTVARRRAQASASLALAMAVTTTARRRAQAAASLALGLTITAAGQVGTIVQGAASLALTFMTSATGRRRAKASSALPLTFDVSATPRRRARAATSMALALSVVTAGRRRAKGAASLALAFTVGAAGHVGALASAVYSRRVGVRLTGITRLGVVANRGRRGIKGGNGRNGVDL